MKKILFIAALFSVFNICTAQDAVYKLLRQEWTLNSDGTSDYHYRHEVQILRNRALVAYADKGETFVVYNPDLEDLTVNEVYTIQKDGTRVNMPQNAFIYQLPSECADCGRFNHIRELAMVHTGMELGCTIVVDYTIHRQYNLLYEYLPLMRECPVEKYEVIVNYNHNDMELRYKIDGVQYLNSKDVTRISSIDTSDMSRTLHYTFDNLQQAPREPYLPADIIPTLHIFNSVPEFTPAFDANGLKEARVTAVQQEVGTDDKKNVCGIRDFVVDNIHLNDLNPAMLGYVHATAAEVWQTGCGTATDKAVLLAAMLNEVGYQARVLGDKMDEVGVMIDTLEYRLSVRKKSPLTLYGEAKDEVTPVVYNRNHAEYPMDTLEDGFYRLPLTRIAEAPAIDVARLALTRTAPLATPQCDIAVQDEYTLAKGLKMVGGKVSQSLAFEGIGQVEISIKQSGKKLTVSRKLKIEKSLIAPEEYAAYRQLMATWKSVDCVLLRSK